MPNALEVNCTAACAADPTDPDTVSSADCLNASAAPGFSGFAVGPSRVVACEPGYQKVDNAHLPGTSDSCDRVEAAFCMGNVSTCPTGTISDPAKLGQPCADITNGCTAAECCVDEDGCVVTNASCPNNTRCEDVAREDGGVGTALGTAYRCVCAGGYAIFTPSSLISILDAPSI
eukprot:COSAG04_NODE_5265_length_1681_cov_1.182680_2_plen_175_part_00